MEIKPNEVKEIKIIGKLHGDDVKVVITDGGFHVGMGKKEKKSNKAEELSAIKRLAKKRPDLVIVDYGDIKSACAKSQAHNLLDI